MSKTRVANMWLNRPDRSKEAQRAEPHRTIWRIANDLRGSVDGWNFKQYVLGILFYRFISENLAAYLNQAQRQAGETDFEFADLSDGLAWHGRAETVREKGFFILPSAAIHQCSRQGSHGAGCLLVEVVPPT